ncbi:F-box/LRR-repeat protein 2 [Ricinus communis]|uniref:F-box/LRR-repeat protein, putative n=1 Tax=Ricinus communis TaxID=3988 RepID=B9SMV8_RICCO|nr:F-box/LRR-repeat protein 2 [Ricinus communis]EEF35079.1 F-box/LRR-repeat protein, putative [Ricinus communis]|eukprot:XP_002527327.1 F-box/LRR-repeat protein 2 [Ricinus communis]
MTEKSIDLPQECWELILNSLDHHRHFESLSLVSTRFFSMTNHLRQNLTISSHTLPFLSHLLNRFPNLKSIQISQLSKDDLNSLLHQLSKSELDLDSLNFENQTRFPHLGLREFGLKMRNLRKLHCSKISGLQDSDLFLIGSSFPLLEDLDISFPLYDSRFNPNGSLDLQCFSGIVTDDGILELGLKLNKLRRIDLSGNRFITDKSLHFLSLNCLLLSEVKVRDCDFITQNGISLIMRNCSNLNSISLDGVGIPSIDSFFQESFTYAKSLCELHLSNSFISDELLYLVAEACLPLKKLTVSHCYNFSFVGISFLLYRYKFLVYLDLEGANFLTDESMIELSNFLCNLSYINLSLCSKLTSLTFFALIKNCPLLSDVKMERTNLGVEEFMVDLITNPRIKSLKLVGNNNLSDDCLIKIACCCPSLQVLEISYCFGITEEGIKEVLRSCSEIRHLEMNRCVGIKNLDINVELPKLEVLQVQGPGIDDEALAVIAKRCQMLLHLDLAGCLNVTEKGVNEVVQNCTKLREMNLKWCDNVKVDMIATMVFSRPSLRKITPPCGFIPTDKQISFFLQHGCLVCKG